MDLNQDFRECIECFRRHGVEYLLLGAHAMSQHGVARYTGVMNLWLRPTPENLVRARNALIEFGFPLSATSPSEWLKPGEILQMGAPPVRIDLLTELTGLEFADAWKQRTVVHYLGGDIHLLSRDDLIRNKRATGRAKDIADAIALEAM